MCGVTASPTVLRTMEICGILSLVDRKVPSNIRKSFGQTIDRDLQRVIGESESYRRQGESMLDTSSVLQGRPEIWTTWDDPCKGQSAGQTRLKTLQARLSFLIYDTGLCS